MRHLLRRSVDESGQGIVEIAFTLPILLVLVVGVVDLSKAYNYWNDSNDLANRAARYAAVARNPGGSGVSLAEFIKAEAEDTGSVELSQGSGDPDEGVQGNGVQVCIEMPALAGDEVRVSVHSEYGWLGFLKNVADLGTDTTITGRADMRLERTPSAADLADGVPALGTTQCSA